MNQKSNNELNYLLKSSSADATADATVYSTVDAIATAANKTWIFKRKMAVVSRKH